MRYSVEGSKPLLLYDCMEATVVCFDPHSGDTHLLSALAAEVIRTVAVNSMSQCDLLADLGPKLDPDAECILEPQLSQILHDLISLRLLARHS